MAKNKKITSLYQSVLQIDMIDAMNDEQLKEYIKNRPEELKTVKIQKSKPRQKVAFNFNFIFKLKLKPYI